MAFDIRGGNNPLDVDMSELQSTLDYIKSVLTQEQFEQLMYRTFKEVGRKTRTIVAKDAQHDYKVTQQWMKSATKSYRISFGGEFPVSCIIPIKGVKGLIGSTFKAYPLQSGRISTQILQKGRGRLPAVMKNQGGNPPFVGLGKLNGLVYTRRTEKRLPIVRVAGLGAPQLPYNLSREEVTQDILDYAQQRLEHHFDRMITGQW